MTFQHLKGSRDQHIWEHLSWFIAALFFFSFDSGTALQISMILLFHEEMQAQTQTEYSVKKVWVLSSGLFDMEKWGFFPAAKFGVCLWQRLWEGSCSKKVSWIQHSKVGAVSCVPSPLWAFPPLRTPVLPNTPKVLARAQGRVRLAGKNCPCEASGSSHMHPFTGGEPGAGRRTLQRVAILEGKVRKRHPREASFREENRAQNGA